ncbi:MAG TPA: glycosyl hydrolase 53 family protein [Marinagarivorans sp.]
MTSSISSNAASAISESSSSALYSSSSDNNASSSAAPNHDLSYQEGEPILGMDISYWSEQLDQGITYVDTDGQTKDLLALLKNHGINYIRLRTFVDPTAPHGYASTAGGTAAGCTGKRQAYNGKDDIVRTAKRIKAAGMGLLLNFHYSDTWADPGKQVIPEAWLGANTIDELAQEVRLYTLDVLEALRAEHALPDMVQIGNESTPGLLVHAANNNTDCWGNNSTPHNGPNGAANDNNWPNLARLLKAGIEAVNIVDARIKTVLHIENFHHPDGVEWWVDSALSQGVTFDVLGLSAYEEFQGPASAWSTTIQRLSSRYPNLAFAIVEYNPRARLLNDIMQAVPDNRGLGTFFWEPTESGFWGDALFTRQGNSFRANASDFAVYDQMVQDYDLRKIP